MKFVRNMKGNSRCYRKTVQVYINCEFRNVQSKSYLVERVKLNSQYDLAGTDGMPVHFQSLSTVVTCSA